MSFESEILSGSVFATWPWAFLEAPRLSKRGNYAPDAGMVLTFLDYGYNEKRNHKFWHWCWS